MQAARHLLHPLVPEQEPPLSHHLSTILAYVHATLHLVELAREPCYEKSTH